MRPKLLASHRLIALIAAAIALTLAVFSADRAALALPPAGSDIIAAVGSTTVESRSGRETIQLSGTVTIQRGIPYEDGGVGVIDTELIAMNLTGQSLLGTITVSESSTLNSLGQIRSLQSGQDYPASAYFDVFARVTAPGPNNVSNTVPIRMTASNNITEWPPIQLNFASTGLEGVNNDGDGATDEDTPDEDGDHLYDEDGFAAGNPDTDGLLNEDPSAAECLAQSSALCDDDGDGQRDEDPTCTPLAPTMPTGSCVVSISVSLHADTDKDGCTDTEEMGTNHSYGGERDRLLFWDFFDTATGSPLARDKVITIGDISGIVGRFGSSGDPGMDPLASPAPAPAYHTGYDRTDDPGSNDVWKVLGPNGSITIQDIVLEVSQFGTTCAPAP